MKPIPMPNRRTSGRMRRRNPNTSLESFEWTHESD
jgi:hypothetical protein